MYSAAPKTVAALTQMLIYVCKTGSADLAKVGTDDEIFATSAIFSKHFTSLAFWHLPQYLLWSVGEITIPSAPVALLPVEPPMLWDF